MEGFQIFNLCTLITFIIMCLSPLTIKKVDPISHHVRLYNVPCGKCAQCTRKKQSEFGALALHQALQSGSVHMFTFTYRPDQCPIAISEMTPEGKPRIIAFARGDHYFIKDGIFHNAVFGEPPYNMFAASLHREDIKLVLKDFRSRWKRFHNDPLDFKYAVFGEMGEAHGRPHYHGVFFGLSLEQAEFLKKLWSDRFGFAHFGPVSNNVTLDDIKKMTAYCSKYVSKGVHSRWSFLGGYVEAPRRQSSINFGDFSEAEISALKDFMTGAIFPLRCPVMLDSRLFYLDALLYAKLDNHILFLSHSN